MLLQLLANGFASSCVYALLAVGFGLTYNTTRIFHVAYGGVYASAAYTCFLLYTKLHLHLAIAVAASMLCAGLLGYLIEKLIYAPLGRQHASLPVALLSSLGLYIVMVNVLALVFGSETQVLWQGVEPTYRLGPVVLARMQAVQIVVALIFLPLLLAVMSHSRIGAVIRAVRDNPGLTMVMGLNLPRVRLALFAAGSALAGMAAVLSALDVGIDPNIGMPALLVAAVAVIVGGVRRFEGAVAGAFLLGLLQSVVVWQLSARWTDAMTFALFLIFLLVRPQGVFGGQQRVEEGTG